MLILHLLCKGLSLQGRKSFMPCQQAFLEDEGISNVQGKLVSIHCCCSPHLNYPEYGKVQEIVTLNPTLQ